MNLREAFSKYPLERQQFDGEWIELWNALERVLAMPARQEFFGDDAAWVGWPPGHYKAPRTVAAALLDSDDRANRAENVRGFLRVRVVLLDGTVIREWGAEPMGSQIRAGVAKAFGVKTQGTNVHRHYKGTQ